MKHMIVTVYASVTDGDQPHGPLFFMELIASDQPKILDLVVTIFN